MSPSKVSKASPYQKGDVVLAQWTGRETRVFLIVHVFTQYLESKFYFIPKYRVRIWRRQGGWSFKLYTIYPGDIGRAYDAATQEKNHEESD